MKIISNFVTIIISIIILQISTIRCEYSYVKQQISSEFKQNDHFFKRDYTFDSRMIMGIECISNDTILCGKIIKTINDVGNLISSVILFREPLLVSVIVEANCIFGVYGCTEEAANFIGRADPGSRVLLMDEFGVVRYYQQPLAKQFFEKHPKYDEVDIKARFALRSDYWFQGDSLPTTYQSLDFSYVVLHEIIHSLGFDSLWKTWLEPLDPDIIVPFPYCEYDGYDGLGGCKLNKYYRKKVWTNFKEFIFDKYLVNLNTGESLTNKTNYLSTFFDSGAIHGKLTKLARKFKQSTQFNIAKEMYGLATTKGTIGFLSWNDTYLGDSLVLETGVYPFNDEYNIFHADNILYTNTSDFLMRSNRPFGKTLQGEIIAGGSYANGTSIGPIGPKLLRVLETLGYATRERPFLTNIPTIPTPHPRVESSGRSSSSITFYQNGLLLIFVTFVTFFML